MKVYFGILLWAASLVAQQPATPPAGAQPLRISEGNGSRQFGEHCRTCHGNPQMERAPDPSALKRMSPESIYAAIATGAMKEQAKDLADADKRAIAEYLAGRRLGASENGDASAMANRCAAAVPVRDLSSLPSWNGWGVDIANTRFQPGKAAGLSAGQVSRLRLKWAFGVPGATSMYQQPTIVDGKVFFSSDTGYVYSLDAESGCVHWSFQAQSGVRSAITIGPVASGRATYAAYFGDVHGNVYSVDAANGELLWKVSADAHPLARITAAPKLYEGRLYVPVASLEEVESGPPNYACCTFRGLVLALDANTGRQFWKTYTIQEEPKLQKKTPSSKEFRGPSGAGVWNSPAIDTKRRALYFGTGNGFSLPAVTTTDAILALDMDTGKILWTAQDTPNDVWHGGCLASRSDRPSPVQEPARPNTANNPTAPKDDCPDEAHPDFDYSASPILAGMPDGRSLLITGQKSGIVYARDPDRKGAVVWQNEIARKMMGGGGEIVFGGAADSQNAYFPLHSGGMVALRLSDGLEQWFAPMEPPADDPVMARHKGETGASTVIPGVVFSAGLDGMVRALSANDGRPLWEYNTFREFETVNGVKARGGSMGAPGPTLAGGMVFVPSGYIGFQNGVPGNVLLAFAPGYGY
jgi:polyvinyl alcohol dehydrogenase (cytochrome)